MRTSIAAPGAGDGDEDGADIAAERVLLGAFLLGESDFAAQAFSIVSAEDFALTRHAALFAAFQALSEAHRTIDVVTVAGELQRRGQLSYVGGVRYLFHLGSSVPDPLAPIRAIAQQVKRNAELRRGDNDITTS